MTDPRDSHTSVSRLVVLGAKGDLVSRHTLPALAHLEASGSLPPDLTVVGVDRETTITSGFRTAAVRLLDSHAAAIPPSIRRRLVDRLEYRAVELSSAADLGDALAERPCVVYLALPPRVVPAAVSVLNRTGLPCGSRLLLEKPVGTDRASAASLEAVLGDLVDDESVYRADHFLHHQLLRDVLAVRFSGGLLEPVWSSRTVDRVEVVWEEGSPVAGRGEFYDRTGALRDMVQSHLLQLLAAVAMEPPGSMEPAALRAARADVLSRVRPPDPGAVAKRTVRGRYAAGAVPGPGPGTLRPVPAYVEEPGVDPQRLTETYARIELTVAGPRWEGVPFSLRTGRAIGSPRREVRVRFRGGAAAPTLRFTMGGGGVPGATRLSLVGTEAPTWDTSPWGELAVDRPPQPLPASALLLRDALAGDARWFLSAAEVDHAWRVVDAVRDAWRSGAPPLLDYPAGSEGPEPRDR